MMSRQSFAWLLVAALAVRVALVWAAADLPLQIVDEQHYTQLAANVVAGNGFGWGPGSLTSIRPPLYPGMVAAVWTLWGSPSLQAVRVVQIGLSLISIVVLYSIARRLFNERTALVASAIFAFYPSLLFSNVLLLTETLFIMLLLIALRGCLAVLDDGSPWVA